MQSEQMGSTIQIIAPISGEGEKMNTILDRMREGGTGGKLADFVAGFWEGYRWAEQSASLQELEMLHKYFIASRGKDTYPVDSPGLNRIDQSILTILMRGHHGVDLRDLSPLDPIGFIEGALEWRLRRNRLQRSLLREKKRRETSHLPVPRQDTSQLGQAVKLQERARAAPCADAGATITAAHAVDNASNGLTAGRREQYLQGPLFADKTLDRAILLADIEAFLSELDSLDCMLPLEKMATETPQFKGRASQPPVSQ
jgi:hypothetical protein